jgi:hypothetical protein
VCFEPWTPTEEGLDADEGSLGMPYQPDGAVVAVDVGLQEGFRDFVGRTYLFERLSSAFWRAPVPSRPRSSRPRTSRRSASGVFGHVGEVSWSTAAAEIAADMGAPGL